MAPETTWKRPQTKFNFCVFIYYFKCNIYGHNILDCNFIVASRNFTSRNAFAPLMDYLVECYKYHNFRHIAKYCRSIFASNQFQDRRF